MYAYHPNRRVRSIRQRRRIWRERFTAAIEFLIGLAILATFTLLGWYYIAILPGRIALASTGV